MKLPKIVSTPGTCGGKPRIDGTRWPVRNVVELVLADGIVETLKEFEGLDEWMIIAALLHTKESDHETSDS